MSVISELTLPAAEFQLGEILAVEGDTTVTLETMVPISDDQPIPFFRTHGPAGDTFEAAVRSHRAISDIQTINTHDGETLYALDWDYTDDIFLSLVTQLDGHLLEGSGGADQWTFRLRFPTHDALSTFKEYCWDADIPVEIVHIYNPTVPEAGPWYGLTDRQRRTLMAAVERGYYSLPRQTSTKNLAETFDVSDQAITERLRRGIETLVTNTLLTMPDPDTN